MQFSDCMYGTDKPSFFCLTNHDQHLQLNLKTFLAKHCINTDNKFRQEAFKLFVNIHYIDKLGQKKNI